MWGQCFPEQGSHAALACRRGRCAARPAGLKAQVPSCGVSPAPAAWPLPSSFHWDCYLHVGALGAGALHVTEFPLPQTDVPCLPGEAGKGF